MGYPLCTRNLKLKSRGQASTLPCSEVFVLLCCSPSTFRGGPTYEAVTAMLGRVPNSYRVLARVPLVSKLLLPFNAAMQREGAGSRLTAKIKEMVVIKTSHINMCNY